MAGLLTNFAGLGTATKPEEVGPAVTFSYTFSLIPLTAAVLMMFWFSADQRPENRALIIAASNPF